MSTRRYYFAAAGIALIGMAALPRPARADGDIPMKYLFVSYGYSSAQHFSKPSGLFYEAKRGELYVADSGNGQIVILDKKGMSVAKIPHSVIDAAKGNRFRGEPRGVVVQKTGDILVVDNLCNYVDVLDYQGHSVRQIWPADLIGQPRTKVQPRCLAQDSAGNVYVGLSGVEREILVLTPDLKLKTRMGVESMAAWIPDSRGESNGESKGVSGLWVDSAGTIFATYAKGICVRAYGPDGAELMDFGSHDAGPQNFSLPAGLVSDAKGRLWVLDTLRHVVSVFSVAKADKGLTSKFLALGLGGMGQSAGDLAFPTAISGDGSGKLYVAESAGARVQAFEIDPAPVTAPAN